MTLRTRITGTFTRFKESIYWWPALALVGGVLGGVLALALDQTRLVHAAPFPRITVASARALMTGVTGAIITATTILFWIRGMLVQLASGQFSARELRWYLEDRFQQGAMAFLLGGFAFVATVLLALPSEGAAAAPAVSTLLTLAVAFTVLLVIVGSVANSVKSTRTSAILDSIASRTMETVRDTRPQPDADVRAERPDVPRVPAASRVVIVRESGWVTSMNEEALLRALPGDATVWLRLRTGGFAAAGEILAHVHAPDPDAQRAAEDAIRAHVHIGTRRTLSDDPQLGVQEIVDVATSALAPGSGNTTTALEALQYLGPVLREIMLRDTPPTTREWEGRRIVRTWRVTHAKLVDDTFDQLRHAGATYPGVAVHLLHALGMLERHVLAAGLDDRAEPLRRQARFILESVDRADLIDHDRERVRDTARAEGFS